MVSRGKASRRLYIGATLLAVLLAVPTSYGIACLIRNWNGFLAHGREVVFESGFRVTGKCRTLGPTTFSSFHLSPWHCGPPELALKMADGMTLKIADITEEQASACCSRVGETKRSPPPEIKIDDGQSWELVELRDLISPVCWESTYRLGGAELTFHQGQFMSCTLDNRKGPCPLLSASPTSKFHALPLSEESLSEIFGPILFTHVLTPF